MLQKHWESCCRNTDRCLLRTVRAGQSEPTGIFERVALKETYFACFQVPNFIWVTVWSSCFNAQQTHQFSHTVSAAALYYPSVFQQESNCDKPNLTWQTSSKAEIMQMYDSVMSQSHLIKGETTDETFQEHCFLRERGASADFFFQHSSTYTRT